MKITGSISGHYDMASKTVHVEGKSSQGLKAKVAFAAPDVSEFLSRIVGTLQIDAKGNPIDSGTVGVETMSLAIQLMPDGTSSLVVSLLLGHQPVRYAISLQGAKAHELRTLAGLIEQTGSLISSLG